jgi:hypothetical protein
MVMRLTSLLHIFFAEYRKFLNREDYLTEMGNNKKKFIKSINLYRRGHYL